jgi:hypothetical protein
MSENSAGISKARMDPFSREAIFSADNVIAKADSPPDSRDTLKWVPLMGNYLNIMAQAAGYGTSMEDPPDFIADDLEKGLQSEFVNKRVAFKQKNKE